MRPSAPALAAAVLFLSSASARALDPVSDVHVGVSSAAVLDLECRKRPFRMELTRSLGRHYRQMAGGMVTEGLDPRPFAMGLFSMVLLTPMTVLAVPADLAAAPFRRECDFTLRIEGTLDKWASQVAAHAAVSAEGRNLLAPADPPSYFVSGSSAVSDAQGRVALSLAGHVGMSRDFQVSWAVQGLPSGSLLLRKRGRRFLLLEPETEFGSPFETLEPIEILPQ